MSIGFEDEVHVVQLRNRRVGTPADDGGGVFEIGRLVGAAEIGLAAEADDERRLQSPVKVTVDARHAHYAGESTQVGADTEDPTAEGKVAGLRNERNGLGTKLFSIALPLLGNDVDSFVPADAFKFALTAFTHALHGILDAIRTVNTTHMGQAFAANAIVTAIYHVTSRSANHLPITHVNVQEAAAGAVATADAGEDLRLGGLPSAVRLFPGFGFGGCSLPARPSLSALPRP